MCIIVCELSQNTTLQMTHAVKEWDKGMLLAYTQMKGINSEESSKTALVRKVNGEWALNASTASKTYLTGQG